MKTLHEAYVRDDVAINDFAGVTLNDLYRVATTFETNVCMYKLFESDEEGGKTTAELVIRTLCHYLETVHVNLHETHVSFIKDVRMHSFLHRCRKCGDTLWKCAHKLHGHERTCTGVYAESTRLARTIRPRQSSNVWTMRTFASLNRCVTTHTSPLLNLSVGLTLKTSVGQ